MILPDFPRPLSNLVAQYDDGFDLTGL